MEILRFNKNLSAEASNRFPNLLHPTNIFLIAAVLLATVGKSIEEAAGVRSYKIIAAVVLCLALAGVFAHGRGR